MGDQSNLDEVIEEIEERRDELAEDPRIADQEPAEVQINAPLALIQTQFNSKVGELNWVLNLLERAEE